MLMTQADWARRHGFTRQYVTQLIAKGLVQLVDGKVDPAQADAALAAVREPARPARRQGSGGPRGVPAGSGDGPARGQASPSATADRVLTQIPALPAGGDLPTLLLRTRIKSEVERAKLLEIKAKVEAGKYVDADDVEDVAFHKARIVRDTLLNIPGRLAPLMAAETDARACFRLIDSEIRQALEELTGGPSDD